MSDDASVASSASSTEHETQLTRQSKFKVLALVDGIMIEPVTSHGDDDDGDGGSHFSGTDDDDDEYTASALIERLAIGDEDAVMQQQPSFQPGAPGQHSRCTRSSYGPYVGSMDELEDRIGPDVDGGLIFTLKILPNNYNSMGEKKLKFLQPKDYDPQSQTPKPRRKMPFPVTVDDFYGSLTRIGEPVDVVGEELMDDLWDRDGRQCANSTHNTNSDEIESRPPRWVFTGVINGWPGLPMPLEVLTIQTRDPSFLGRRKGFTTSWNRDKEGRVEGKSPSLCCKSASEEKGLQVKAKLRAPQWSAHGWSRSSPGFIFWVEGQRVGAVNPPLVVTYGTNLKSHFRCPEEDDPQITRVHMINHRYATGGTKVESQKDKLTYHGIVLLEWDHAKYCSVVETGFLNGLGGYRCKSNWYVDRDALETNLYAAFPPEMIMPWKDTMSEIRVHDVPYPDLDSFLGFMKKHSGHEGRFVGTNVSFSHAVRLTYRSRRNIVTYLLNYIRRDRTYSEMKRNCQTFAADLCGFLAGKRDVRPYHPVNQIQYTTQKHKFLYESSEYR
mmetsp:Transcript_2086/g.4021  ORF Transcript_2086/g.4021 Transcript_2086/m.4021 type:complete len:554 (+) Transcript_2086:273-1934(+)